MTTLAVRLAGVTKRFGEVLAVDNVTLEIEAGSFFTLLGPSGSGKTTTLRLIAGFDRPDAGSVLLHGDDVTELPPFERDANTVFQDYALFPHMSVLDNVAYGLKVRRIGRTERRATAAEALALVRLEGYGDRRPSELSGGQRQRVALARALVLRPRVLLLDEPLGALDQQLREEMQVELKGLQREVGITFVLVTHDQSEALAMSDQIAIFDRGQIVQTGTPQEIYERPSTQFVAAFVGSSNILTGALAEQLLGAPGTCMVRAEHVELVDATAAGGPDAVVVAATVLDVAYLGAATRTTLVLASGATLIADGPSTAGTAPVRIGAAATLSINRAHVRALAEANSPKEGSS